jgi:hypothetical protein
MNNHPVFIAQYATATCCRGCLEKWHQIPKDRTLNDDEIAFIVDLIMTWIEVNISDSNQTGSGSTINRLTE